MYESGFRKLYWGFLFIMVGFRIQGFDILPDIVGYILFAMALNSLGTKNEFFNKAKSLNIPMIILSIFSIYQRPANAPGINFGPLGIFGVLIGLASAVLNLIVVYNIFMGIKEMAEGQSKLFIGSEAQQRWSQFLYLEIAVLFSFILIFIPPLAIIYIFGLLIVSIILTVKIMGFINRCDEELKSY